jgi:hypothetical protein
VSWNLMLGKNLRWVAKQYGHSVQTMLDVYAAWVEGSKESELEAIRQAMEASPRARAWAAGGGISGASAGSAAACVASTLACAVSPTARATSAPSPAVEAMTPTVASVPSSAREQEALLKAREMDIERRAQAILANQDRVSWRLPVIANDARNVGPSMALKRGDPRTLPGRRGPQNISGETFRYRDGPGGRSVELISTHPDSGGLRARMSMTGSEPASLGPSPLALAGGEYGAPGGAAREATPEVHQAHRRDACAECRRTRNA